MKKVIKKILEKTTLEQKERSIIEHLTPFIKGSDTVLDIGARTGRLTQRLQSALCNQFFAVDIEQQSETYMPVSVVDGKKLPFEDNTFDCVLFIDVLHHDMSPDEMLAEAMRVSSRYVLIKDHHWESKIDLIWLKFIDYLSNKPFGVKIPNNFFTIEAWKNAVRNINLRIIGIKLYQSRLDPTKQIILKLEKSD